MNLKSKTVEQIGQILFFTLLSAAIIFLRPFNMDLQQSIILGTLLLVLVFWTLGTIKRVYASIFLLIVFSLFGKTPLNEVFKFPLSTNFYMIALSFLLSKGIVNSKAASRFSNNILNKYCDTPYKLILMSFIFSTLLIFVIPQSFSRVILLSSIYGEFFRNKHITGELKEVLYLSLFLGTAFTSMLFLNGDIILNYSVSQFAGISMGWIDWAKYMTLPTTLTIILTIIGFSFTFKSHIKNISFSIQEEIAQNVAISTKEKKAIIIMALVIIFWMTEPIHLINSAIIALIGTVAMFYFKIIDFSDLSSLNFDLLIFLTSAMAIGSVMNQSGVAKILYGKTVSLFPSTYSYKYLFILVFTVIVLHMILGSSITTMSVSIPILIELTNGIINPVALALLVYTSVSLHFLLPFHHILIMMGAGNNFYSNKKVLRLGLFLTLLVFFVVFLIYIPWWKFVKLI